jgi:SAM-dependent methyltransferase
LLKKPLLAAWTAATHCLGRLSGRYYFEDFVRVYPDGIAYDRLGRRKSATRFQLNNYLNHRKFYAFAAQFVPWRTVADIGCGSGYGCALLRDAGAARVAGSDLSRSAIAFAKARYGTHATFTVQGATDLRQYASASFDVAISSEVLEHVKEYRKEDDAIREMKRVTKPGGVIVIGTPNSELLDEHGFSYDEIDALLKRHFEAFCLFENALVPLGEAAALWERRVDSNRTGILIAQAIDLTQTALPVGAKPRVKSGCESGTHYLGDLAIDTRLLHNTHSWIAVALNPGDGAM